MKIFSIKAVIIFLCILVLLLFLNAVCGGIEHTERQEFMMGTIVNINVYADNADKAIQKAFETIKDIEQLMSTDIQTSDIAQINRKSGVSPVNVSQHTLFVVQRAVYYSKLTQGKFDISIWPIVKLWGIGGNKNNHVPTDEQIKHALEYVGYENIKINKEQESIFLTHKGMGLDVGGIAKGYAADQAAAVLKDNRVDSAFISLGGNVCVIGSKPDGQPWKIGIQHPRKPTGSMAAVIEVEDKSVVTSGDYQRFFEADGMRYHHILDPDTGYPAMTGCISATVIADKSIDADALSTCVFLLGPQKGMQLIESIDNTEAVVIDANMQLSVSSGLKGRVDIIDEDIEVK